MSQLIASKYSEGIVLGADSKAVDVDNNGSLLELKVDRLHQLSQYTAILNGGALAGESMCRALKSFISEENLDYIDDIHQAALPFLAGEYARFMRNSCEQQPLSPTHQLTFILGGYTPNDKGNPFQLHLLWTKQKLPLLDTDEIASGFTVPRIIKVEYSLNQMHQQRAGLDKVAGAVRVALETRAEEDAEVSAPLRYALIDAGGYREL